MKITKTTKLRTLAAGIAMAAIATAPHASALLEPPGRKAPEHCAAVKVQKGDTVWAISAANGLTLDQTAAINEHIPNLSRIYPGDEIAVNCDGGVGLGVPQTMVAESHDWSAIKAEPYFSCVVNGRTYNYCVSAKRYLVSLFETGWRGEELITMAAISVGEGGGAIDAEGDTTITDATWGPSYGVFQIRALWAADGSGAPRDRFALWNEADPQASLDHQAWAAREVYLCGAKAGKECRPSFKPWTAFLKKWHLGHMDHMRNLATELGMVG
jgi:hypothetical protein